MQDISKNTVFILLLVTILISVISTWFILKTVGPFSISSDRKLESSRTAEFNEQETGDSMAPSALMIGSPEEGDG